MEKIGKQKMSTIMDSRTGCNLVKEIDPRDLEEKRRRYRERQLHQACMDLVKTYTGKCPQLQWMIHVPNGEYRTKATAAKLKRMGVKPGVPDLICPKGCGRWRGVAIEIKVRGARLRKEQAEWMQTLAAEGWLTATVTSTKEMEECLEIYRRGQATKEVCD